MANRYNPQHETAVVEDLSYAPLTNEQFDRTRRVVASWVAREGLAVEDATKLMKMLGVYPGEEAQEFKTPLQHVSLPSE